MTLGLCYTSFIISIVPILFFTSFLLQSLVIIVETRMRLSVQKMFTALVATAATCAATPTEEPSWRDLMRSFEIVNPTDFIHLGDDGVLRHFNESGTVLNYAPLNPQQITQMLSDTSSLDTEAEKEHLSQVFRGVDGRTVKGPALLNPPAEIYPTNFLNNTGKASEVSEVPQSDHALDPRQHCPSRRCVPKEDCSRYPGCTHCNVKDNLREGTCE
ncbi:hypothetical protein RU639_004921 [Aspergillus parasiticus]